MYIYASDKQMTFLIISEHIVDFQKNYNDTRKSEIY